MEVESEADTLRELLLNMDVSRESINNAIDYFSDMHGVPRVFSHAIAHIESRHRQTVGGRILTSPSGAQGVMQLMPATARGLGVNPLDYRQNIEGGIRYFAQRLRLSGGDVPTAIAMYYAGIGNVQRNRAIEWPGVQAYIRRFNAFVESNKDRREEGTMFKPLPKKPFFPTLPKKPIHPKPFKPSVAAIPPQELVVADMLGVFLIVVVVLYLLFIA